MLKRLLNLIATNDGTSSIDALAQKMGIPGTLVKQLLAELVRAGYLRTALGECTPVGCAACPAHVSCHQPTGVGLWELTNKGRRLLT
jgi:predicted ArsR family transcriptional regulator